MAYPSNWKFHKEDYEKIFLGNIFSKDLNRISISINKWWKTRYKEYKMILVSKIKLEKVKQNHNNKKI